MTTSFAPSPLPIGLKSFVGRQFRIQISARQLELNLLLAILVVATASFAAEPEKIFEIPDVKIDEISVNPKTQEMACLIRSNRDDKHVLYWVSPKKDNRYETVAAKTLPDSFKHIRIVSLLADHSALMLASIASIELTGIKIDNLEPIDALFILHPNKDSITLLALNVMFASLSPNEQYIAYVTTTKGVVSHDSRYLLDISSGALALIFADKRFSSAYPASWTQDSKHVVFTRVVERGEVSKPCHGNEATGDSSSNKIPFSNNDEPAINKVKADQEKASLVVEKWSIEDVFINKTSTKVLFSAPLSWPSELNQLVYSPPQVRGELLDADGTEILVLVDRIGTRFANNYPSGFFKVTAGKLAPSVRPLAELNTIED